jgi:hypothetical protein
MKPITKQSEPPRTSQRSQRRDSLLLRAEVRSLDGHDAIAAIVRNLSAGGMMAENEFVYPVGTLVEVQLRNLGAVTGRVAWTVENRMGIAFDREIDPAAARKPMLKTSNLGPKRTKPIRSILE